MCGKQEEHWLGSLVQVSSWSCGAQGDEEGRSECQSSTGSQCSEKCCSQVSFFMLLPCRYSVQRRRVSPVWSSGWNSKLLCSSPACVPEPVWQGAAVYSSFVSLVIILTQELKKARGSLLPVLNLGCVGNCSPSFAKKLSFFSWFFFFLMQPQTKTITFRKINMHPRASWGLGRLYAA